MHFTQEVYEFSPVSFEFIAVGGERLAFRPEGDFLELEIFIPIKIEIAVKASDRFLGAEDAVESDPGQHDFGDG